MQNRRPYTPGAPPSGHHHGAPPPPPQLPQPPPPPHQQQPTYQRPLWLPDDTMMPSSIEHSPQRLSGGSQPGGYGAQQQPWIDPAYHRGPTTSTTTGSAGHHGYDPAARASDHPPEQLHQQQYPQAPPPQPSYMYPPQPRQSAHASPHQPQQQQFPTLGGQYPGYGGASHSGFSGHEAASSPYAPHQPQPSLPSGHSSQGPPALAPHHPQWGLPQPPTASYQPSQQQGGASAPFMPPRLDVVPPDDRQMHQSPLPSPLLGDFDRGGRYGQTRRSSTRFSTGGASYPQLQLPQYLPQRSAQTTGPAFVANASVLSFASDIGEDQKMTRSGSWHTSSYMQFPAASEYPSPHHPQMQQQPALTSYSQPLPPQQQQQLPAPPMVGPYPSAMQHAHSGAASAGGFGDPQRSFLHNSHASQRGSPSPPHHMTQFGPTPQHAYVRPQPTPAGHVAQEWYSYDPTPSPLPSQTPPPRPPPSGVRNVAALNAPPPPLPLVRGGYDGAGSEPSSGRSRRTVTPSSSSIVPHAQRPGRRSKHHHQHHHHSGDEAGGATDDLDNDDYLQQVPDTVNTSGTMNVLPEDEALRAAKTEYCRHEAAGRCTWGASCRFAHRNSPSQGPVSVRVGAGAPGMAVTVGASQPMPSPSLMAQTPVPPSPTKQLVPFTFQQQPSPQPAASGDFVASTSTNSGRTSAAPSPVNPALSSRGGSSSNLSRALHPPAIQAPPSGAAGPNYSHNPYGQPAP